MGSTCAACGGPAPRPSGSARLLSVLLGVAAILGGVELLRHQALRVFLAQGTAAAGELPAIDPRHEPVIRSVGNERATEVTIVNQTAGPVTYHWLDFDGRRKIYGVVAAGAAQRQPTYVEHYWLIENGEGRVLRISGAQAQPGTITVR